MAKSNLKKRSVKPTSTEEDFGKKQLFMHKSKEHDMVVLSAGIHKDEQFSATIVHSSEQLNVGIVTTLKKTDYVPVNGQFKVILK